MRRSGVGVLLPAGVRKGCTTIPELRALLAKCKDFKAPDPPEKISAKGRHKRNTGVTPL